MGKKPYPFGEKVSSLPDEVDVFRLSPSPGKRKKLYLRAPRVSVVNVCLILGARFNLKFILPESGDWWRFFWITPRHVVK